MAAFAACGQRHDPRGGRGTREQQPAEPDQQSRATRRPRTRRPPHRRAKLRILPQDRLLELLQRSPRLKPELGDERFPRVAVHGQRLGLTTRSIQRKHQLRAQPLTQREPVDQRVQLADKCCVLPQRKVGIDPILKRSQPLLLEPRDLALRERLIGEVRQRRPAPQSQCPTKTVTRDSRVSILQRAATLSDHRIELLDIDPAGRGLQQVRAPARDQQAVAERFAQMRDVALDDLVGARRRLLTPQLVHQTICRDRLTPMQDQQHQQRSLLGTAERQRSPVLENVKRPQDSEFDHGQAPRER